MDSLRSYTIEEEVQDTKIGRPHVVILGAGASRAAFLTGDRHGQKLPIMQDLIPTLGLGKILRDRGIPTKREENFESTYSRLQRDPEYKEALLEVEDVIRKYFSELEPPDTPTIYDYLVLSLRKKDVIATFNWDPFLFSALTRNYRVGDMPHAVFLHGAVNVGYCHKDKCKGSVDLGCTECLSPYTPSKLLYPVEEKDYTNDPAIHAEWETIQFYLKRAYIFTIFGYSAPKTDAAAMRLLKDAWGKWEEREYEQIEMINTQPEEKLRETWKDFIHTHHYEVTDSFFQSLIWTHPRRTCEAMWATLMDVKFTDENPPPKDVSLKELQEWYKPLIEAEKEKAKR
jgi:hypothetical protein